MLEFNIMEVKKFRINKILKFAWDEITYGGYFVGINNALILLIAIIITNKFDFFWMLIFVSFLIVTVIYKVNHLKEVKSDKASNPERSDFVTKNKNKEFILVISFILLALIISYLINFRIFLASMVLLILGIIYPKNITKKILGFKNLYTALTWSLIIFLPYILFPKTNFFIFLFLYIFIFIRSFINIVFSDLKDINDDRRNGLKTYPVVFGERITIKILNILNAFSLIPLIIGIICKILPLYTSLLLLSCLYTYLYLKSDSSDKNKLRKRSYILVDGEAIIWVILLVIGKVLIS
jgi:4-hydroxybenzoate polyprenyltransferase